jgi:hypothetical protein
MLSRWYWTLQCKYTLLLKSHGDGVSWEAQLLQALHVKVYDIPLQLLLLPQHCAVGAQM